MKVFVEKLLICISISLYNWKQVHGVGLAREWFWLGDGLSPCREVHALYTWKLVGRVVGKSSENRVLVECWSKVLGSMCQGHLRVSSWEEEINWNVCWRRRHYRERYWSPRLSYGTEISWGWRCLPVQGAGMNSRKNVLGQDGGFKVRRFLRMRAGH